ncbi:hypothetical protein G6F66_012634 [Rhizopus arrhizus]|nr:hypothetical protein G6F66_012634 [Rhizopus arrhizus]
MSDRNEQYEEQRNPWSLQAVLDGLTSSSRSPVGQPVVPNQGGLADRIRLEYEQRLAEIREEYSQHITSLQEEIHVKDHLLRHTESQFQEFQDLQRSNQDSHMAEVKKLLDEKEDQLTRIWESKVRMAEAITEAVKREKSTMENRIVSYQQTIEELNKTIMVYEKRIQDLLTEVQQLREAADSLSDSVSLRGPSPVISYQQPATPRLEGEGMSFARRSRLSTNTSGGNRSEFSTAESLLQDDHQQSGKSLGEQDGVLVRQNMMEINNSSRRTRKYNVPNSQKDELERGTYENAKKAFTAFFGGDAAAQSSALASIDNLKQNKELMVSFGPKLLIEINRVTKENHVQLYFFYRAIDPKLADKVAAKEPSTLHEAIDYAVRLERNARERQMGKGLTPKQPIIFNGGE